MYYDRISLVVAESNVAERKQLTESLRLIHEVLSHVNEHVDSRQKQQRLADICRRIDAKAFTMHHGHKFKVFTVLTSPCRRCTLDVYILNPKP